MITKNLQQKILQLKASDKMYLMELIFESLDKPDTEIQTRWIEESENRFDAYKAGKVKAHSYEEVLRMIEK